MPVDFVADHNGGWKNAVAVHECGHSGLQGSLGNLEREFLIAVAVFCRCIAA